VIETFDVGQLRAARGRSKFVPFAKINFFTLDGIAAAGRRIENNTTQHRSRTQDQDRASKHRFVRYTARNLKRRAVTDER
jgi:hypothetical protein